MSPIFEVKPNDNFLDLLHRRNDAEYLATLSLYMFGCGPNPWRCKVHILSRQHFDTQCKRTVFRMDRFLLVPTRPALWKFYQKQQAALWTAQEIDTKRDAQEYEALTQPERRFIGNVLAFFAAADGIVTENLGVRFLRECHIPEARAFWAVQGYIETVHAETYALLLTSTVRQKDELDRLLHAAERIPSVQAKAAWSLSWIEDASKPFPEVLVAFAVVEGIMFSSSFCAIYWFKKRGLLPGITKSNEFIARDEGLHADFACALFKELGGTGVVSEARVHEILRGGTELEEAFVRDSLPLALLGMNADSMVEYVRFVANRLCRELGVAELWPGARCTFEFMDLISMDAKDNFFETRPTTYQAAYSGNNTRAVEFTTDDDF